jgi:hypothetical protein
MIKKLLEGAVVKKIAARTPIGAAAVVGVTWYVRKRRRDRAAKAATTPSVTTVRTPETV